LQEWFSEVPARRDGEITGYEADIMKVLTAIILFLTMLTTGCSDSHGYERSSWRDVPIEDASRRLDRNLPERQDRYESNEASTNRH
jgi:hypothetical protein